jgi:hypothetical protein
MKKYILGFAFILLAACAKDSDTITVQKKSVFSIWTSTGNTISANLTGGSLNIPFPLSFTLSTGERCDTSVTFSGTEESGNYSITGSSYASGTGGGTDPGCGALNEIGTYSREGVSLKLCKNGGGCTLYY